jgi:chemotaxis methyl-accepting protein methylase
MIATQPIPLERPGAPAAATPLQLEILRHLIADRYGFWINDSWAGQVAARLAVRTQVTGRAGVDDYLQWVSRPGGDEAERAILLESLLNGETHFLRTEPHFAALLETVVPAWRETRSRGQRLRIASLGCSTGEEPYSVALVLHERLSPEEQADVEVTGLDLSGKALAAARTGIYETYQLRELSAGRRARWFRPEGSRWVIDPALRASVRFLQHNLLRPLPFAGLDVIFCRNVLIYFQRPVVAFCFGEFHAALRPGGYLFLGHSESAFGFPEYFDPVQVRDGVIYQNKPSLAFHP